MSGGVDIWIQGFAPGSDPVPALQRVFGIDEQRAVAIQQTVPRAVKRNASPRDAEEIARALRSLGAKVELRPHRGDARASGAAMPRPGEARASVTGASRPPVASPSLPPPLTPVPPSVPPAPLVPIGPAAPDSVLPLPMEGPSPARRSSRPPPSGFDVSDTTGGGGLELAFDPKAERDRVARLSASPPRPSAPPSPGPAPHEVAVPPAPSAVAREALASSPSITFQLPGWIRGAGIATLVAVALFLFRLGRCACTFSSLMSDSPEELAAAAEAERDQLVAGALPLEAFLRRPNAMLGRDMDRNLGLARSLERAGARRVLVANVTRVSGTDVGLTLVVELPEPPALRRRVLVEIARYYAGDRPVSPDEIELPPADEPYEIVDLD